MTDEQRGRGGTEFMVVVDGGGGGVVFRGKTKSRGKAELGKK